MTINLPNDLESSVRAEVQSGRYASEDLMVAEIIREYFRRTAQSQDPQEAADPGLAATVIPTQRKPLWERAAELRQTIPEDEWAKLPTDGAEQLDHYLHGSPRPCGQ